MPFYISRVTDQAIYLKRIPDEELTEHFIEDDEREPFLHETPLETQSPLLEEEKFYVK